MFAAYAPDFHAGKSVFVGWGCAARVSTVIQPHRHRLRTGDLRVMIWEMNFCLFSTGLPEVCVKCPFGHIAVNMTSGSVALALDPPFRWARSPGLQGQSRS